MPFAILHHDPDVIEEELGHKPKNIGELLTVQNDGLLVCEQGGAVFYLDEGSREDIAATPAKVPFEK